jgi:hypothetical protein
MGVKGGNMEVKIDDISVICDFNTKARLYSGDAGSQTDIFTEYTLSLKTWNNAKSLTIRFPYSIMDNIVKQYLDIKESERAKE